MPTIVKDVAAFAAPRAWDARDLAEIGGAAVRLHWTDQPYVWHVNDGTEVFAVLAGTVDRQYREAGAEHVVRLQASDIFIAHVGEEHVAHPIGEARIRMIERKGSI